VITNVAHLSHDVKLVNPDGTPTPYFQQMLAVLLEEKQITDDLAEGAATQADVDAALAALNLDALTDVDTTTVPPTDQQALVYDNASSLWIPGAGAGGGGTFSGALVKKAADQTAANYSAFPAVAWDAEEYDTDNYHDNATNNTRLTVPADGHYIVGGEVTLTAGTLTTSEYIRISITRYDSGGVAQSFIGLPQNIFSEISAAPTTATIGFSSPIYCNVGDYFVLNFDTEADTSVTVQAANSWFAIEKCIGGMGVNGDADTFWYVNPPLAADFTTAFHGGTAGTYSDDTELGYSVKNNYTGASWITTAMAKAVPAAGTDFSVTAHIKRNSLPGNYSGQGLTLFESGTNKVGSIGIVYDTTCQIDPWNGTLTAFTARGTRYTVAQYGKLEMFFRIRRVGTTIYFEASQDGKHFDTLRSGVQTTFFTTAPTHIGPSMTVQSNPGGALNQYCHCDYWAQSW